MKMSQQSSRSLLHKHKMLKNSNVNHSFIKSCHSEIAAQNCKPVCCSSMKADVDCNSSHKVKRLKSRKERNQNRSQERHVQHSRRDVGEKTQCHRIHPMSSSKKERRFAKPFIAQKPSIITERRLTSIRGLFSHEVRSIDIERLVSEQMKRENQKKEQRKQSMDLTSPLLPSVPDSDQDCIVNEVQEPENNTTPKVKRKEKRGKEEKECAEKNTTFQTNKQVTAPKGSSRVDGKLDRNSNNTRKEDANNNVEQNSQCSPRETEHVVLSSSEDEPVLQLSSTPDETNKNNSDISQTDILKSNDEENQNQRLEETSTTVGFPNMEHPQRFENQQTLNSQVEPDSGPLQPADNVKQEKQKLVSCRAAVKRLATRLCQASDLYVPSHRRPLLADCRETLMQTLHKRHSFQLEHNLHRLQSLLNGKQTAPQVSSGYRQEHCSPFSFAVENEDRCYNRNMEIWKDGGMHQDFLSEKVTQNWHRGALTKKCRIQKTSSPPFFLKEKQFSNTDMFDEWRAASLSQDCIKAQPYPNQDQHFTQHAVPIFKASAWVDHPVDPYSQQHTLNRVESLKNGHSELSRISQLWRENPDINWNSYHIQHSRSKKPREALHGGSSFWSNQRQVHEEKENLAPVSFSASYRSEGFQYEPFFLCPRPSNTQRRTDCFGMSLCPNSSTSFYPTIYQ